MNLLLRNVWTNLTDKPIKITNSEYCHDASILLFNFGYRRVLYFVLNQNSLGFPAYAPGKYDVVWIAVGRCRVLCHPRFHAMVILSSAILN